MAASLAASAARLADMSELIGPIIFGLLGIATAGIIVFAIVLIAVIGDGRDE